MTKVLLTEAAWQRHGSALPDDVVPLRLQADGSVLGCATRDAVDAEVAWGTFDLFDDGGPARAFFGFLLHSPTIRWFQSPAAGADHPVFARVAGRGVVVTTSHVTDVPIAEYVLRAVLDAFQRAGEWRAAQAGSTWERHEWREVAGSRWLVYGLGAIGSAVAVRARAFGAEVIGVRRTPGDGVVHPSAAPGLLPSVDVVVLAAPLSDETQGLVADGFLGAMREGSVLVNVARGGLVDEAALLRSLDMPNGPHVAVLDVASEEPLPPDSPLWSHPRVVLTPHNAAAGHGRGERALQLFLANLARWRAGEPLPDLFQP